MANLDKLEPVLRSYFAATRISREDGEAAIRAFRRGVSGDRISEVLGVSPKNLRSYLGTWALNHAVVPDATQEPRGE